MVFGVVFVALGAWFRWGPRVPWLGHLPGDLAFHGEGWRVYLPLGTSLLLSALLTLAFRVLRRR